LNLSSQAKNFIFPAGVEEQKSNGFAQNLPSSEENKEENK
jgi:hypothetical protein